MRAQDCCNQNCRQGRDCPQRLVRDAAPDMLALLQRFALFSEGGYFVYPLGALHELRTLIAKATGTTP